MALPVSEIWEDTMDFVRREWGLLAPVSLALLGLSNAAAEMAGNAMGPDGPANGPGWAVLVFALSVLVSQFGQLAIIALALKPGASVGEALNVAARRMPKLIAITLIMVLVLVLAALPLAMLMAANGVDLATTTDRLPASAALGIFIFMGLLAWLFVRLLPLNALLVDADPPIGTTLKTSFAMTRGHATILLGLSALYLLISLITAGAATFVVGSAFGLLGQWAGIDWAGALMGALAGGMVAAALGAISNVFLTRVYQKLKA
jgi:hypothetical protein